MGMEKLDIHDAFRLRRTAGSFDDFHNYATAGLWTSVTSGSATVTAGDGVGGLLTLAPTDSTDNLLCAVRHTNSLFSYAANTPIVVEALLQFTEANTSAANIIFGLMSAAGTTPLQSNGAGPKANCSGAMIYKVDGGTVWKTCSSIGTTQTLNTSTITAGGSTYQRLKVVIEPISTTIAEVTYYVNDVQLLLATGRPGQNLIKDQVTYTGGVAMQLFAGVMNGSTTPETLLVDYMAWEVGARRFST